MTIKILTNETGNPAGKLADVELHFTDGPLEGLKLMGFSVWERRGGDGRNVTFPARSFSINGERRSFALLRPFSDNEGQRRVRDLILQAYEAHERALVRAELVSRGVDSRGEWIGFREAEAHHALAAQAEGAARAMTRLDDPARERVIRRVEDLLRTLMGASAADPYVRQVRRVLEDDI